MTFSKDFLRNGLPFQARKIGSSLRPRKKKKNGRWKRKKAQVLQEEQVSVVEYIEDEIEASK